MSEELFTSITSSQMLDLAAEDIARCGRKLRSTTSSSLAPWGGKIAVDPVDVIRWFLGRQGVSGEPLAVAHATCSGHAHWSAKAVPYGGSLDGASLSARAEAARRPGPGLRGFDGAIAGWSVGDEGVEQLVRRLRHLVHRAVESGLVGLGRPSEAAQLAHELEGRGAHLLVRRRRLEVVQGLDVPTHALASPPRDQLRATGPQAPGM